MKKLFIIFLISFLLNWIWETLHSNLYIYHQGREITQQILLRATLFDAVFITLMSILFIRVIYFKERQWYAIVFGLIVAILIEVYALGANRWEYSQFMPIIPLINTGLTPTIQLGLLSYITYKLVKVKSPNYS